MLAPVEHAVEVHGVQLPPSCDGRHIFVQTGNERNMSGTRFGRDTGMGNAKGAMFENTRSEVRGKRTRNFRVFGILVFRRGIWKRLKGLVGA